jgi:hypothetical protein
MAPDLISLDYLKGHMKDMRYQQKVKRLAAFATAFCTLQPMQITILMNLCVPHANLYEDGGRDFANILQN